MAGSSYIPGARGGPGLSPGLGLGVPGCVWGVSVAPMSLCLGVGVCWVCGCWATHRTPRATLRPRQHSPISTGHGAGQRHSPGHHDAHTTPTTARTHTLTQAAQHSPQQGSHGATTHNTQHNTRRPKPASRPAASTWALLTYLLLFYNSLL